MPFSFPPAQAQSITPTGASATRPLKDKLSDSVSVADFGAKPDGQDARAAINAAVVFANLTGKAVQVPAGTYMLSAAVTHLSGVRIIGEPGATFKAMPDRPAGTLLLSGSNRTNVSVEGITFDGSGSDVVSTSPVVQYFNAQNVTIRRCTFQNTIGISLNLSTNIRNLRVEGCHFSNCGAPNGIGGAGRKQAIALTEAVAGNSRLIHISDNRFETVGLDCISLGNTDHVTVANNHMYVCGAALIYNVAGDPSRYWNVTGNVGMTTATGLGPNYPNGIDLKDVSDLVVSNNTMYNTGGAGIGVFSCNRASVTGNVCINNGQDATGSYRAGIVITASGSSIVVSGNVCTDNQSTKTQRYGILIDTAATGTVVAANNYLTGNADYEIAYMNVAVDKSVITANDVVRRTVANASAGTEVTTINTLLAALKARGIVA